MWIRRAHLERSEQHLKALAVVTRESRQDTKAEIAKNR